MDRPPQAMATTTTALATVPQWDALRRELCFGGQLIKRFAQPAPDQVLVLTVFQEESWAASILDPLPRRPGRCAKHC